MLMVMYTIKESKSWLISLVPVVTAFLLVSCGGSEPLSREDQQAEAFLDLRSAVMATVSDDQRRGEVLAIVDLLEKDITDLRALLVQRRTELRELNADYDASQEDFLRFTREMEDRIQNSKRLALERRQELLDALTAEEWDSLAKSETRAMKSIARSVQGI